MYNQIHHHISKGINYNYVHYFIYVLHKLKCCWDIEIVCPLLLGLYTSLYFK